ncbi:MAG: aminotransferase class I/II-fold pyridoxal phosphate-dependent enzyme, partial [Pseudomonadota bacterium]|nr:aminotransferase class I/II-fold pyridoxal phosphate-dependent enzyme [Pseudomonadota bacterium]
MNVTPDIHQPSKLKELEKINPFRVMTVMHRAAVLEAEGRKIVHMEVGEPDFNTATPIIEAAKRALDAGFTHYTAAAGIDELRCAVADHYLERYGVRVAKERILVTPGASGGLSLLANLLVGEGDGVLITDPAYPCVRNFIQLMNASPQLVPVDRSRNFQPTVQQLEGAADLSTSGVWLASPSNPTGTVLDREALTEIGAWCADKSLHLLVDEI